MSKLLNWNKDGIEKCGTITDYIHDFYPRYKSLNLKNWNEIYQYLTETK